MSILVVGSVALDTINTPRAKRREILGGSATFSSISAGFFNPVSLVAVVGRDFPSRYLRMFEQQGVDLAGLAVEQGKTFRWEGEYGWDFGDPKTLSTCLNVFSKFDPQLPREYKKSKYLFLANIDPQIQERVLKQLSPKLVVCDTMNYWIENKRKHLLKLLKKVDIFLLNESEARQLSQQNNMIKAGKDLLKLGPGIVIVKKGENGCLIFSDRYISLIPAFLLESIIDPTGAGDTFAGGLVGYLSQCNKINQINLKRAVIFGSILAAFAVEDFSVRRLLSVKSCDIRKRFKEFQRLNCF